jgi:hypothetical protein
MDFAGSVRQGYFDWLSFQKAVLPVVAAITGMLEARKGRSYGIA